MHPAESPQARHRRFSERTLAAILLVGSSLLGLGILEAGIRVRNALQPVSLGPAIVPDAERGWRARPGYDFRGEVLDCHGNPYEIAVTTDGRGFRVRQEAVAGRPRILFLGDSFTFARAASQDSAYYAVAGGMLDATVVAYGAEGYNNLQAYLVLDEYLDEVRPDLVVLQVCSNDIINHSLELTRLSRVNQLQAPQPYLDADGGIVYRDPGRRAFSKAVAPLRSHLLRGIAYRLDNWGGIAPAGKDIEDIIADDEPEHPLFVEAAAITGRIFDKFQARCGDIPLVVFNVDEQEPYHSAFARLCAERGIPYLTEVPRRLSAAAAEGAPVHAADCSHWSDAGHTLCGEVLARALEALALLPQG